MSSMHSWDWFKLNTDGLSLLGASVVSTIATYVIFMQHLVKRIQKIAGGSLHFKLDGYVPRRLCDLDFLSTFQWKITQLYPNLVLFILWLWLTGCFLWCKINTVSLLWITIYNTKTFVFDEKIYQRYNNNKNNNNSDNNNN